MSWRDRLLPASFRGVPFHVDDDEAEGGKRVAVHEYPGRDVPSTEEFGRRARRFYVRGYTIGSDYDVQLAALRLICEAPGGGLLVLPQQGAWMVHCENIVTRTTRTDGGYGTIDFEGVEVGGRPGPTARANPAAGLSSAVIDARGAVEALGNR